VVITTCSEETVVSLGV